MHSLQALALLTLMGGVCPAAQGEGVRVSAYELDVRFEPEKGEMRGTALVFIDPQEIRSDHLVFYLHGELRVERVLASGKAVPTFSQRVFYGSDYSLVANEVRISTQGLDVGGGLSVTYSGPFHPSRARSASDYMRIEADGVHLRSFGYSLWFPVFLSAGADSHPVDFLRIRIDTPEDFVPVFTGTFREARTEGGRRISAWEARCDLFDAQCTARRFEVREKEGLFVYALGDSEAQAVVPSILDFASRFDDLCGDRYGKREQTDQLHVMQTTEFGDIASGNTIGISTRSWLGFDSERWPKVTLAHELVHAYVAVPIRRSDPLFALVVEGFPSYFHLPVLDEILGGGFLRSFIEQTERDYLARRKAGGNLPELALSKISPEQVGVYKDRFVLNDRALLFLDFLRRGMGTETFGAWLRALFSRERLDRATFEALIAEHLPGSSEDVALWLDTTEFPDRLRLAK